MDGCRGTRVALLDGFAVHLPGLTLNPGAALPRAAQRVIAHVSLCGSPTRAAIAGQLWPDVAEDHAHGSLRSALWRVRKVAPGLLRMSGDTLTLAPDVRVDVRDLTRWARRALDPFYGVDEVEGVDVDVRGELLPGWYDDWVLLERESLRQLRLHALEAVAEKLSAAARYGEAVQAAYAAVRIEPLRESAQRTVVRVHLAEGNICEAVRAYESFRTMLADEIGAVPSRQMRQLVYTIPRSPVTDTGSLGRVSRA
jgi:DNA-binding SARP family transcriptional activator